MSRDGFVFYRSFYDAISVLPKKNQLEIYSAVCRYAFTGEIENMTPLSAAIFTVIKPQVDANNKRYESGMKGGRPRKKTDGSETEKTNGFEKEEPKEKEKEKEKEKDKEKDKEKPKVTRFHAPTVQEVNEYAAEKGYRVNGERFVSYYESNGWKVGKNPMKDWRAAVRTWSASDSGRKQQVRPEYMDRIQVEEEASDEEQRAIEELIREVGKLWVSASTK